jgi:hypothetical protein
MRRMTAAAAICSLLVQPVFVVAQDAAGGLRLADGTKIPLRLMETLSSATAKDGDPVNFSVLEDVVVNGAVVIKQGTPVRGTVVEAEAKRRMGRAGKLSYTVSETKSIDRQTIRLRATQQKAAGDSHVTGVAVATTAVAVFVPIAAPFMLLRKGKDVVVAEGTRVEAFVDGEHALAAPAPAAVAAHGSAAAASGPRLTNDDVVALRRAGFGDDVIVAKIRASTVAFHLDATDLVGLKSSGISDKVIATMLDAGKQ